MSVMATLDDVRRIALALPEVQEKPHFGMPAFRVADKGFVSVAKDHSRVLLYPTQPTWPPSLRSATVSD